MKVQLAMLLSDWLIWALALCALLAGFYMHRQPHLREPWQRVFQRRLGMVAFVILVFYMVMGLLDSIHLRITTTASQQHHVSSKIVSVFDLLTGPLGENSEKTYSAPFATHLYTQALVTQPDGSEVRTYPALQYAGNNVKNSKDKAADIFLRILIGMVIGALSFAIIAVIWVSLIEIKKPWRQTWRLIFQAKTSIAWREAIITFGIIWVIAWVVALLVLNYHIFGTEKIGRDVFYEALKSIRTGLLIGTLTTLFMLPFALILGTLAGYFRGWTDDIIQYLYTTLSSIPGVLLISAAILVMQVYISNHPEWFPTLIQRADARLLALCFILGITSWASLCRLLRGETLKLRSQEYVLASRALGTGGFKIISRHIIPNVMHIVLITIVLDFSGLVLAEAVLSYVGVGVDPTTLSWGNMINSSRLELAREPIVWWPLLAALVFMFILVLSANLFADAVRDAFDPRLR